MSDQGPRNAARLLRLPRRALGSPANLEPDRERVRDRAPPDGAHQGRPVADDGTAHGLQARRRRIQDMATAEGREPVAQGRRRCQAPGRNRSHRRPINPRRLITSSPNFQHSSVAGGLVVARCDGAELFEFVEEPLDEIALSVEREVTGAFACPVALGRDDRAMPRSTSGPIRPSAS